MMTDQKKNTRTKQILKVMYILAWVVFIGLLVEMGTLIVSYVITSINPDVTARMYMGAELSLLQKAGVEIYAAHVIFTVLLMAMKTYVALIVIQVLSRVKLESPFKMSIATRLENISHMLFWAFALAIIHNQYFGLLQKSIGMVLDEWPHEQFLVMAGLIFIISQVFRRGVELQAENDLTI